MALDIARLGRSLQGAGEVREATSEDAVDGVGVEAVGRPTTIEAVSALVREANDQGLKVVARGAGTAMTWAAPPESADLVIDVGGLDQILEYEANDLVVVTEAGTPLKVLSELLAGDGQELVIDIPPERYEAGSTVGGVVATGTSGPRRLQRLAVRDLILGATVVLGDGTVAASGGKVVKNVAGYDLAKIMTGSYGTLGIIVKAAFRLHPRPTAHAYVTRTGPLTEIAQLAHLVVSSQLAPAAVEIDRPAGSDEATVAVLLEGSETAVSRRSAEAARLIDGDITPEPSWWARLPDGDVTAKATATLLGVEHLLTHARVSEQSHGVGVAVRGSAIGVLHLGISASRPEALAGVIADLRGVPTDPSEGTITVLQAPTQLRDGLDIWGPVAGLELMRSVKAQLDPGRTLAPGRFVGGI